MEKAARHYARNTRTGLYYSKSTAVLGPGFYHSIIGADGLDGAEIAAVCSAFENVEAVPVPEAEDVQEAAFEAAVDAGMFDYPGRLADDCAAAIDMWPSTIRTRKELLREQLGTLARDAVEHGARA